MKRLTEAEMQNIDPILSYLDCTVGLIDNIGKIFDITFDQACKIYEITILESLIRLEKEKAE